jgi:hypothetical protein
MPMWMVMRLNVEGLGDRFLREDRSVDDTRQEWTDLEARASLYSTRDLEARGLYPRGKLQLPTGPVEVVAVEARPR